MSGEAEPRRSVRATKGQHTKSFEDLELAAPKRRQTKKSKKAQEQELEQSQEQELEQSQEPEEVIRCVCGATEQDEDSGEAWISCETCFAWQHNVCVGVSSFEDEIPDNYWCERCRPQDHVELLEAISKGERPWEGRRKAHAEESERKKRKGGRRAKGKRMSDSKEELDGETTTGGSKVKASPTPEAAPASTPKDKKEPAPKQVKRKSRDNSQDVDGKSTKLRRVSEHDAVPVPVPVPAPAPAPTPVPAPVKAPVQVPAAARFPAKHIPPADLAATIAELPGARVGPAKALKKSLLFVIGTMVKKQEFDIPEDASEDSTAESYALQVERAVFDTHPVGRGLKEYTQQIKSLAFNLKNNAELCHGLLGGIHTPATLAVMTSEQMASAELQRQTAEMRARAEKQSILYTQDSGPRVRRTHKGEEVVEDESAVNDTPMPTAAGPRRKPSDGGASEGLNAAKRASFAVGTPDHPQSPGDHRQSPTQSNFDINKVFSTVKTPTTAQIRRPSGPALKTSGPGIDADVDRMLEDENESPPYSPTEEAHDPDVVWRGSLAMSSVADFQATAKHVGGANFASVGPWTKLIPKRMTVAGRIQQQSAIEYLCSLRYSNLTDIVVVSITPSSSDSQPEFERLVDYFSSKSRYGVVGDKVAGNVRDTYLVPVPAGEDGHPEFMYNLVDNYIPKSRTEPMLLAVFVYRNDPEQLKRQQASATAQALHGAPSSPAGQASGPAPAQRTSSMSGPAFSPATPQTPVPIPQPPHARPQPTPTSQPPAAAPPMTEVQNYQAQQAGQSVAREVLGAFISAPTVQFLLPQAFQMSRTEWEVIRRIYEKDHRAREDLTYLGTLLEKEGAEGMTDSKAAAAGAPNA
ncbi:hypothetical protein RJ55_03866 [Drechmeria coniospora]|nr:hypothetical protein RJ55_03866 [Drechmeria coniospora]